jgi:hypothetical protein
MNDAARPAGHDDHRGFNPYASSQVQDFPPRPVEEEFHLTEPIFLGGRGSLEKMVRAIWQTYGLKHRARSWLWTAALLAAALYALVAGWPWWWPAVFLLIIATLVYLGVYVPTRLERHMRQSAADFDLLYRGEVTDTALSFEKQTADGEWVAAFPDEAVVAWSEFKIDRIGDDYLLFVKRRDKLSWFLSLPRELFTSEEDWRRMVEFTERKLLRQLVAPRCANCRKRLGRSELRPMPWAMRLCVGNLFTVLELLFGHLPAEYCKSCWPGVYRGHLVVLIILVTLVLGILVAIVFIAGL